MRAVLGKGTRAILAKWGHQFEFVAPEFAFDEAVRRLPPLITTRRLPLDPFMDYFGSLRAIVQEIESATYAGFESAAFRRDEDDWPILTTALALECPIYTEDTDFFGCGVATWTSDRVEMYLRQPR